MWPGRPHVAFEEQGPVPEGRGRLACRPVRASASSACRSTMRMPRPPPPAAALTMSGQPTASQLRRSGRALAVKDDRRKGRDARGRIISLALSSTHGLDGRRRADRPRAGRPRGLPGRTPPTRRGIRSRGGRRLRRCDGRRPGAGRCGGRCPPARSRAAGRPAPPRRRAGSTALASEWTATVAMPMARAVRMTRRAISPRLATRRVRRGEGKAALTSGTRRSHGYRWSAGRR